MDFSPGLAHPVCRWAWPGVQSGRACPWMYCLMMDSGAPSQETAKWDGDQGCPRMRARTQRPVNSCRTAWAVRSFRRCTSVEIAMVAWVGDEQVHVVGFAVELDQLDIEIGAHGAHGVLGEGEHLVGEHRAAILGHEHQMCLQRRHAVPGAAIGLGCHRSALQSDYADALPVPHRTDTGPAADAGAGVRLLPGGVQRRTASTRRGLPGRGETLATPRFSAR